MASPDQLKPKSNKRGALLFKHPSLLLFFVSGLLLVGTILFAAAKDEGVFASSQPVPALQNWFADLNAYHSRKSAYPPSLIELEREIWIPARQAKGSSTDSQLQHGPRMFLYGDYAYLYQRDAKDPSICSVWAIPQGERYREGLTYFEIITPKSITEWRGGALTPEKMKLIPSAALPTGEQMATLGMYIQKNVTDTKPKQRKLFGIIPY